MTQPSQQHRRKSHNDDCPQHRHASFPSKLYDLLENADNDIDQDIVSWLEDGNAFRIHNRDAFCEKIMKLYFKQSKFTSFTRQLYLYGFSKITAGPRAGGFYHPDFKRNNYKCFLLRRNSYMDRRLKKGGSTALTSLHQAKKCHKNSKATQGTVESFITSHHLPRKILDDALEDSRQPRPVPSLTHTSTNYYHDQDGAAFEAVSSVKKNVPSYPQRTEDSLLSLLLKSMSKNSPDFLSDPFRHQEESWDLEPRPIEEMIASS